MAGISKTYEIKDGEISLSLAGGTVGTTRSADVENFVAELGKTAPFNTGWMPPGVRMFTQAGQRAQAIIECQPGINLTWWGEHESDTNAKLYELAQPYRVIIADFMNNVFYGARMFYSPVPINGPDTPLYHANVPNLNCRGYGGNGVGWICLYHNNLVEQHRTIGEKIAQVIERCSGAEAYNNANMSETDGPRFYSDHGKPDWLTHPIYWEKKSLDEGYEWTLDDDLWIPVLVKDKDNQDKHYDNGQHLTIGMAAEGGYMAYYSDTAELTPAQKFRQGEEYGAAEIIDRAFNTLNSAHFGLKGSVSLPDDPLAALGDPCERCSERVPELIELGTFNVCESCKQKDYFCEHCENVKRRYAFVREGLCKLCHKNGVGKQGHLGEQINLEAIGNF